MFSAPMLTHVQFTVACDLVDNIVQSGLLSEDHCAQVAALRDTNQQVTCTSHTWYLE